MRRLASGETLFAAGDETRGFFAVRSGRVRLVRVGADGRETSLFTAGPGERFAEASLFTEHCHCDAVAVGTSVVACFPRAACLTRLNDDASTRLDLTADLARQVMMLRARLTLREIRSARQRVLAFLVAKAGEDGRTVAFDGSLREIASAIGLSPEAFYRTLARLEAQGAIKREAGRRLRHENDRRPAREGVDGADGVRNGALRAVHLAAHIEASAVLSKAQITDYDALRGYGGSATAPARRAGKH